MNGEDFKYSRSRSDNDDCDDVAKDLFTGESFPHDLIVRLRARA